VNKFNAAVCTALNGPAAIEVHSLEMQPLPPGTVRVAIRAAGVNFPDVLMTYGTYQLRPDAPYIPGMEFSGEIMEAPPGGNFAIGDRVMGANKGGCFAEQIIISPEALRILPPSFSFEEGACWQTAASTAWHALHDKAGLKDGETVLVLGAGGGVGMACVKLAKHMGCMVIGTGSTEAKRAAILDAGADQTLDPADPDMAQKVKSLTNDLGCNVVCDPVGGSLAITATRAIAWGGRYLIIGFASGDVPKFAANHALIKGYSLIGLRAGESARRDPTLASQSTAALSELAETGIMRPHISHKFPLVKTSAALQILESKQATGRVIINL
jgi:NADPH:quinone reductase